MRFAPTKIITNGDMSTSAINSIGINLDQIFLYSVQAVWTGSPVGVLKIQISNDIVNPVLGQNAQAAEVVNWTDYAGSQVNVNGAGNFVWNMTDVGYQWVRLVYTKTSGTGTLNAISSIKGA